MKDEQNKVNIDESSIENKEDSKFMSKADELMDQSNDKSRQGEVSFEVRPDELS